MVPGAIYNTLIGLPETSVRFAEKAAPLRIARPVRFLLFYFFLITVFGKGPTYVAPPVYISELALMAGVLWMVDRHGAAAAMAPDRSPLTWSIWLFAGLGACILATCAGYGIEAIRDSAIWYYAAFYFIGAQLAKEEWLGDRVWRFLRIAWGCSLIWGTTDQLCIMLFGQGPSSYGPMLPWRGERLLFNSTNELVEHMALASLIVFTPRLHRGVFGGWHRVLAVVSLTALSVISVSRGRGVKVGMTVSMMLLLALFFAPGRRLQSTKRVIALIALLLVAAICGLALYTDQFLHVTQLDRFAMADPSDASGTAYWRLIWWKKLWAEVNDVNPLFGLGFGQSLGVYNQYIDGTEPGGWPVRSPHNFNMTVFSRMGYTGAALWVSVLAFGVGGLFLRIWRGRAADGTPYDEFRREELAFWLVVLVVTLGNSTFGVLMEGPVLGTWFWFALGFASLRAQGRPRQAEVLPQRMGADA
jgi:hypothetical protein